jgi:hypothetical protein
MRCSQPQGLSKEAEDFLRENARVKDFCPCCGRDSGYIKEQINETDHTQAFDDCALFRYHLKDGIAAEEYVQFEVWDSGPMTWLGLKVGERKFEWSQDDINRGE